MTIIIRNAAEDDIAAIFEVRTSVRENHVSVEQMAAMGITTDTICQALRDEPYIWVAERDGRIVGFSMADAADAIGSVLMERAEAFLFKPRGSRSSAPKQIKKTNDSFSAKLLSANDQVGSGVADQRCLNSWHSGTGRTRDEVAADLRLPRST